MNLSSLLQATDTTGDHALSRHRYLPTRAGVIELVVLFGLLIIIDRLMMQPGDFAKLQPHPYWLPVVLLSLQYGTADGVLAAATAILVNLALGWSSQGIAEDYYRYLMRVWSVPVAWILTAVVIGEVRTRQRSRMTELVGALYQTRKQSADITIHCQRLEEKIQRLERGFATDEAFSLDGLATALRELHTTAAPDWTAALARAHRGLVGVGALSLFVRHDRGFVRLARIPDATASLARAVAGDDAAIQRAALTTLLQQMADGKPLAATRIEDARLLDGVAAMALPLRITVDTSRRDVDPDGNGRFNGALLLEGIDAAHLTADVECRLDLLKREIAIALSAQTVDHLASAADGDARIDLSTHDTGRDGPESGRKLGIFPRFGRA